VRLQFANVRDTAARAIGWVARVIGGASAPRDAVTYGSLGVYSRPHDEDEDYHGTVDVVQVENGDERAIIATRAVQLLEALEAHLGDTMDKGEVCVWTKRQTQWVHRKTICDLNDGVITIHAYKYDSGDGSASTAEVECDGVNGDVNIKSSHYNNLESPSSPADDFVTRFNSLKTEFDAFAAKFNSHTHSGVMAGPGSTSTATASGFTQANLTTAPRSSTTKVK
jgi:hypothetical protein